MVGVEPRFWSAPRLSPALSFMAQIELILTHPGGAAARTNCSLAASCSPSIRCLWCGGSPPRRIWPTRRSPWSMWVSLHEPARKRFRSSPAAQGSGPDLFALARPAASPVSLRTPASSATGSRQPNGSIAAGWSPPRNGWARIPGGPQTELPARYHLAAPLRPRPATGARASALEMMRLIGEDLLDYIKTMRARIDFIGRHSQLWELDLAGSPGKVLFLPAPIRCRKNPPRRRPIHRQPRLGRSGRRHGLSRPPEFGLWPVALQGQSPAGFPRKSPRTRRFISRMCVASSPRPRPPTPTSSRN